MTRAIRLPSGEKVYRMSDAATDAHCNGTYDQYLARRRMWYRVRLTIVIGAVVGLGAAYFALPAPAQYYPLVECGWEGCNGK